LRYWMEESLAPFTEVSETHARLRG
jgi:hypothetical protein